MKIKIKEVTFWIVWIYPKHDDGKKRECICNIETENHTVISTGVSICNNKDIFSKDKARKLTLYRALIKLWPDTPSLIKEGTYEPLLAETYKNIRKRFWNAYFKRS